MLRTSALQNVAIQGRFGADKGEPGVLLSVVHSLSIAMVIARKGKSKAVKDTLLQFSTEQNPLPLVGRARVGAAPLSNVLASKSNKLMSKQSPPRPSPQGGGGSTDVLWAGPDQYFVQSSKAETALLSELQKRLSGLASITDQSHGRVVLRISGPKARAVLAKGTPVDLYADEFPIGKSALTQMAHVSVHLTRTGQDEFTMSVFRGFSESFWEWLTSQSAEFGYQVS